METMKAILITILFFTIFISECFSQFHSQKMCYEWANGKKFYSYDKSEYIQVVEKDDGYTGGKFWAIERYVGEKLKSIDNIQKIVRFEEDNFQVTVMGQSSAFFYHEKAFPPNYAGMAKVSFSDGQNKYKLKGMAW